MFGFKTEIKAENSLWKNIMYSWLSINREYIEDWYSNGTYEDCAYWYNERASLSILAGAIWRRGGVCLEEYCSIKAKLDDKTIESKERHGRTDLYFYLGDEEYIVEAKYIMGKNITEEKIHTKLKEAIKDCNNSLYHEKSENHGLKGMAIVFIVPFEENKKIDFDSIKDNVDVYCSLKKELEGNIEFNGNIANSCYVIGKELS
ncbi:hypothetical protein [Halarcobacter sp.]|uniref:hypothetical protein n=1 Tax=Halarcobacter sp. TaxID=2321133 RepID=UPI003A95BA4E